MSSEIIENFYYYFPSLLETKESKFSDVVFDGLPKIPDTWEVREVLKYAYDNNDGWEWMPNSSGETVVLIDPAGNEYKFSWVLDFEPEFYVS